ncbi:MAG: hypothetical protein HY870_24945 [Chloroflexi bacterium]|nr:hypothetical protein [Chloroflexota bacterium]
MKTTPVRLSHFAFYAVLFAALLALPVLAHAQTGGGYDLTWSTIDGGGGNATGGAYKLDGTIGQTDAGSLSGGGYTLSGGFWVGAAAATLDYRVYLPLVLR